MGAKLKFHYKTFQDGKPIARYMSGSQMRFRLRLNRLQFKGPNFSVWLKVSYPDGMHNDGQYDNRADLIGAWEAFTERELLDKSK